MRDDKLIAALNKAKTIIDDGVSVCDMMDRKDAEQYLDAQEAIDEALAALQETHAVVPREPVAWRRPSISGRHRWIFAYAREAAHFNQGEWEPLYAAAPQPEEAL